MAVRLSEPSGPHTGAEHGAPAVGDRLERDADLGDVAEESVGIGAAASQQPQEVGLARPVRAEHGDAIAEPDLQVERLHQARQLQLLGDDRALAGARSAQAQIEVLRGRTLFGRARVFETTKPSLGGTVTGGELVTGGRLRLHVGDEPLQFEVLLIPPAAQLVESGHPVFARGVVAVEAAAVHPGTAARAARLQRHDAVGGTRQQLAVVGHEQHGLRGLAQTLFEPALAGHIEVVVGLVEQQHLVGSAQQRFECETLLLAAREAGQRAEPGAGERDAESGDRAGVPDGLVLVAARLGVVREGTRVPHLRVEIVAFDDGGLGILEFPCRRTHARRGDRDEQIVDGLLRRAVTDELVHDAQSAVDRDDAGLRGELTADEAQERGLAGPVGADEGRRLAVGHPERHLVEKRAAVRQHEGDGGDVDVAHSGSFRPRRGAGAEPTSLTGRGPPARTGRPAPTRARFTNPAECDELRTR